MKVLLHSFDYKGKQKYWNREGFCELVSFLHHQSACSSALQHSFVRTSVFLRQHSSTFKAGQTEVHLTEQGEYEWRNKVKFRLFFNHSYWGFMEVVLLKKARKDHEYWKKTGNVKIMKRITDLLNDIQKHPFTGIIGLCRFSCGSARATWEEHFLSLDMSYCSCWFFSILSHIFRYMKS